MSTFAAWKEAFLKLDDCPWPGPRPMGRKNGEDGDKNKDKDRLVGRTRDAEDFVDKVLHHKLVVLTGDSGVGKSSLLNVSLVPTLETEGFHPFVCNNWTRLPVAEDSGQKSNEAKSSDEEESQKRTDEFILSKIADQFVPPYSQIATTAPLCEQLEVQYGDTTVIIFDQFEELIRHQPALFADVMAWLVRANARYRIHIVLSLRSEYRHRLRWLEHNVRPFSMTTLELEPVEDEEDIKEIIDGDRRDPRDEGDTRVWMPITPEASARLLVLWTAARGPIGTGVGLLHLQATLYALHGRRVGSNVGVEDVVKLEAEAPLGTTIFGAALHAAVSLKLDRCRQACSGLPQPLTSMIVEGTRAVAHRLVPHLSSGGFKLEREEWDLARTTLARELERLTRGNDGKDNRPTFAEAEAIFRHLTRLARSSGSPDGDLLTATRDTITGIERTSRVSTLGEKEKERLNANGVDVAPWAEDIYEVSSGPLLGFSAMAILIEELRRIVFAMCWLESASLVRASSPSPGQTMLMLIHDGFGNALERWSNTRLSGPEDALAHLCAPRGEAWYWLNVEEPDTPYIAFDGSDGEVTLTNLRWRDCQISAAFRQVLFVNCDFRGTRFRDCRFEGVVFINCLLDGASLEECTVVGDVTEGRHARQTPAEPDTLNPHRVSSRDLPDFRVRVSPAIVAELRACRGIQDAGAVSEDMLYSRTSGVAAIPWKPLFGDALDWRSEPGGLSMYGGRLSSLMIRGVKGDGVLALRHVAGSALDIVEQAGSARVEITGSAIRGLTVTRPVHLPREHGEAAERQRLEIVLDDCLVSNVWFGEGLSGSARFVHCQVWQLCNVSNRGDFDVAIEGSPYYGLINVGQPDADSHELAGYGPSRIADRERFADLVRSMDYRRVPGKFELAD